MNFRLFILGIISSVIFLNSCNDDLNSVGLTTKPDSDGNATQADTFFIKASTFIVDSIYFRSTDALLGQIYDPLYGNLKSDYLCQFYIEDGLKFENPAPVYDRIDSVTLQIFYGTWMGDSISPMTAEVYPLTKTLDRSFYTNVNPLNYYDYTTSPLGTVTYTPRNYTISDSAWNAHTSGQTKYAYNVKIELPEEFGNKFYNDTKNHPEYFKNQSAFNEYFKGMYVTTTSNSTGNILKIQETRITFYYQAENTTTSTVTGEDSTFIATYPYMFINHSPEVVKRDRILNDKQDMQRLVNDPEHAYIKTPAGVYTQLTIPTASEKLMDKIDGRTINNLFFTLSVLPDQEWDHAVTPPDYLLLLPKDSMEVHFEKNRLYDSSTLSYLGIYNGTKEGSTRTYSFGNIANVLSRQMEVDPENDIEMVLIPVGVKTNSSGTISEISPLLDTKGLQIRKDSDAFKVYVTSSKFNE